MKPYVSIDIETTGLDPDTCQILEIGAVIDDWVTPVENLPTFQRFIKREYIRGQPYALQMNATILKKIATGQVGPGEQIVEPGSAVAQLHDFLKLNGIDVKRIPAAGKNFAGFDMQFLKRLDEYDQLKFNHRVLDPAMLFLNFETDDGIPDSKKCMERAGLAGDVAHTALEDALMVVRMIRYARLERV